MNRKPGLWALNKWTILTVGAVLAGQSLLIGGLLMQRRRRRRSEERNKAILRAVPDLMFLQTTDGVFVDYHAPDVRVSSSFLLSSSWAETCAMCCRPRCSRAIEPAFAQAADSSGACCRRYDLDLAQGKRRFEARLVRSNNDQILTLVRDITDRTASRGRPSRERATLRAGDRRRLRGRLGLELRDQRSLRRPQPQIILGFDDAEIPNRPDDWGSQVHPRRCRRGQPWRRRALMATAMCYEIEHRMVHKDGSVRWFLSRGSADERCGWHAAAAWSEQRWTSPSGSAPKRRCARTRPSCRPAIERFRIWPDG